MQQLPGPRDQLLRNPAVQQFSETAALITGTVGGGGYEGRTQEFALEYSLTKESHYFHYQLDKNVTDPEEAICGGTVTILIDADPLAHLSVFSRIAKSMSEREAGVLITKVSEKEEPGCGYRSLLDYRKNTTGFARNL